MEEVVAAPAELRRYVSERLAKLSEHELFDNGLEGALPASPETSARVDEVIRPRVDELVSPGT